jgi:3-hydroxyacyl-CoA dehydrogenase
MEDVGQVPVLLKKEVEGFVMNRMQAAVVNEAMHLVADGVMSPEDVDKTMRYSIGLRWSFMGPFETMDLNAPEGFKDYAHRYRRSYESMGAQLRVAAPWEQDAIDRIETMRRRVASKEKVADRQAWRDRRLMALLAHMAAAEKEIGQ